MANPTARSQLDASRTAKTNATGIRTSAVGVDRDIRLCTGFRYPFARTGVYPARFNCRFHHQSLQPYKALALGFLCQNGCLQQIAANRLSTPQDVIAILLQGFVRRPHVLLDSTISLMDTLPLVEASPWGKDQLQRGRFLRAAYLRTRQPQQRQRG
jgi:hypothetical protein